MPPTNDAPKSAEGYFDLISSKGSTERTVAAEPTYVNAEAEPPSSSTNILDKGVWQICFPAG
eukprot:7856101-Pyramimonas_sp.AAC.1